MCSTFATATCVAKGSAVAKAPPKMLMRAEVPRQPRRLVPEMGWGPIIQWKVVCSSFQVFIFRDPWKKF